MSPAIDHASDLRQDCRATWLAIADTAYWYHRYERAADGRTPTAAWESEGDLMLIAAAEALCACRAKGGCSQPCPAWLCR